MGNNAVREVVGVLVGLVLMSSCTRGTTDDARPVRSSMAPVSESATPSLRPDGSGRAASTDPAIRFVLNDSYIVGDSARVQIENVGNRPYRYQLYYQACALRFFDGDGRRFIVPPGTHCDLISFSTIEPGETRSLFTWKLDECVKDNWGCVRSQPLVPGTYTIAGRFKASHGGSVRASITFELLASS